MVKAEKNYGGSKNFTPHLWGVKNINVLLWGVKKFAHILWGSKILTIFQKTLHPPCPGLKKTRPVGIAAH
jgi:hypothetical protein